MATIRSQMSLNDGMSAVLRKITSALDTTLAAFEQVQRASGDAIDVANLEAARAELSGANRAVDEMAEYYRRAAQEEERLNESISQGAEAAEDMLGKVVSLVGAYLSVSAVKGYAAQAMEAANTQIGAQVQLHTVLDNMGAMDSYTTFADAVDGRALENTLVLDTADALDSCNAFFTGIAGSILPVELRADNTQAISAYDAILDKASEIQGRGIYGDEIMIAGAAEFATYFEDADAILSMMDTLTNYAAGMSGGGALDSTAMVDYATNLGKIMSGSYDAMTKKGFAFTEAQQAIIEGTATEQQIVEALGAEYLDCSQDMQAAAAINAVIAESWDGLYETMSNTPEGKLIQLNNTLGDISENVGAGIYPAFVGFVDMVQSHLPQIEQAALGFTTALGYIITALTAIADGAMNLGSAVVNHWSWIAPIVWGVVAALVTYNAVQGIGWLTTLKSVAAKIAHAAASAAETAAIFALMVAQDGLNAALAACPMTWIIIAVIALVAGLAALCAWIAKTTGAAQTAFGVITGGINVVIQFFVNLGLVAANIALGIWNAIQALCSNMGTAFHNTISNVQSWFYDLLSTALSVVEGICAALNKLPFVEFDYSGISAKANEYAAKSAAAAENKAEYTSVSEAFSKGFGTFDAFSSGWASDAFSAGAAWGDSTAGKISSLFDGLRYKPGTIEDYASQAMAGLGDGAEGFTLDDMAGNVGDIADGVAGIADTLSASQDELKYLREIAEREAINRFTTAEIKIEMNNQNTVSSSTDLDGILSELESRLAEAVLEVSEGVHT